MKVHQPKVRYLTPSPHGYTSLDESTSETPLRLTRRKSNLYQGLSLNYGQYFNGIREVISRKDYQPLLLATTRQLGRKVSVADIEEILIYSEKHGSDYHPARIEVIVDGVHSVFVMNVALTDRGRTWVRREFEVLQHLRSKYHYPFLPHTYFQGEAFCDTGPGGQGTDSFVMFLADWFQGYHEFHLSMDKEHGGQGLILWDTEKRYTWLSRSQVREVYLQAARILTLYYDLETFEQIFPWHHAAGDFVIKAQDESIDVRLITARQYAPMLEPSKGVSVHEALFLFLLNLSLRMRLDRLDGVGPVAWADDDCVDATLEGFLAGLRTKEEQGLSKEGFPDLFLQHTRSLTKEALSEAFHALIDAADQRAPDIPILKRYCQSHILKFHTALQSQK